MFHNAYLCNVLNSQDIYALLFLVFYMLTSLLNKYLQNQGYKVFWNYSFSLHYTYSQNPYALGTTAILAVYRKAN